MKSHIIPETYLKRFTNTKNKIWCCKIRKESSKIKEYYPAGIAYLKDYYKVCKLKHHDLLDVVNPQFLEDHFNKKYENNLSKLFEGFSKKELSISFDRAYSIAELMIHLKLRSSYARENLYNKLNLKSSIDEILRTLHSNKNLWRISIEYGIPYEELMIQARKIFIENIADPNSSAYFHNMSLIKREENKESSLKRAYWKMVSSDWEILIPPIGYSFITSDNPGYTSSPNNSIYDMGFGIDFTYTFPISSNKLLRIINPSRANSKKLENQVSIVYKIATGYEVDYYNVCIASLSVNEIYGNNNETLADIRKVINQRK